MGYDGITTTLEYDGIDNIGGRTHKNWPVQLWPEEVTLKATSLHILKSSSSAASIAWVQWQKVKIDPK